MASRRDDDETGDDSRPRAAVSLWARLSFWLGVATTMGYACLRAFEVYYYRTTPRVQGEMFRGGAFTLLFFLLWTWTVLPAALVLAACTVASCRRHPGRVACYRLAACGIFLAIAGPWALAWATAWLTRGR